MKKSQLKTLIREVIQEAGKTPRKVISKRKPLAARKPYTLLPPKDPLFDGEMELKVRGKVVASLWPSPEDGEGQIRYMTYPQENEYGCDGPIEDVAKWIVDTKQWID
jgi:hypothetical protein